MPASLFKSKPKSDRRLQWKTLKAKHAKALTAKKLKVEIGLGKALDSYQKQVDALVKLETSQVNEAAFAPVLAQAAVVKRLATNLEPKVNGMKDFTDFLSGLKKDADWWTKASEQVGQKPGYVGGFEAELRDEAIQRLNELKGPLNTLDALLKPALKKTKTYQPPADAVTWNTHSLALRPKLAQFDLLSKKPKANHKLLLELMRSMEPTLADLRTKALHMNTIENDNLPPVVDWQAVGAAANEAKEAAFKARQAVGRLRD